MTAKPPPLSPTQMDAYSVIVLALKQWGLQSLATNILKWVQKGYDANTINYLLQQTPEYEHRFAGNAIRQKNGLAVLSPGDYLATESAYRQVLQAAGLPSSFYASPADFVNLIGGDISPSEVQQRANQASAFVNSMDPNLLTAMQAYHGIDKSHLVAYYLDPANATNILAKQSQEALMGQSALDQGLRLTDLTRVDQFIDQGITPDAAKTGYQDIAAVLPDTARLGEIYKNPYSQNDAEDEFLGGLASAQRKRKLLAQTEADNFSGSGGIDKATLAPKTSGSY